MKDLIEVLTILSKYSDTRYPTHCEHDVLLFPSVKWADVSEADQNRLDELGCTELSEYDGCVCSYRFGSC
jgi:hypothetical protein